MRKLALNFAEGALLFAALFCTLSPIHSQDNQQLPLLPGAAFAVVLFGSSRFLRWQNRYFTILIEAVAFAAFAWASNAIANSL